MEERKEWKRFKWTVEMKQKVAMGVIFSRK
jgi:hypothetical protein